MQSDAPGEYVVDYLFDGRRFSVHLWAESWDDAVARLQALRMTSHVEGRLVEVIHVNSITLPFGWLRARIGTWWRNL